MYWRLMDTIFKICCSSTFCGQLTVKLFTVNWVTKSARNRGYIAALCILGLKLRTNELLAAGYKMIMIKKQSFSSSRFVWPWSQHASLEVHVMWTESNKYVFQLKEKYLRNNCRNTCVTCYGAGWQRVKWSGSSKHVCQSTPILCRWQVVIQKTLISGGDDQDEDENLHFQAKEQKHNWWK